MEPISELLHTVILEEGHFVINTSIAIIVSALIIILNKCIDLLKEIILNW